MNVTKSTLKIINNAELSNYIKSKFDIELIGNTDLNLFLTGNLKKYDFKLKLNSNLKNSYLKINYLDLIKEKNITSSIVSEISLIAGELAFLKNGTERFGEKIKVCNPILKKETTAEICNPIFVDPNGDRLRG